MPSLSISTSHRRAIGTRPACSHGYFPFDLFRTRHHVEQWTRLCPIEIETGPGRKARLNIGLAYVRAVQIELIEPIGGDNAVYREPLPSHGFAMRHHHLADSARAYERQRDETAAQGIRIAVEGQSQGVARYFYSDWRDTLCHYIEHIHYTPAGLGHLAGMPRA